VDLLVLVEMVAVALDQFTDRLHQLLRAHLIAVVVVAVVLVIQTERKLQRVVVLEAAELSSFAIRR
jgi:hypothetical protein